MDKKQIANLLGAGTLTGLILASIFLFGQGRFDNTSALEQQTMTNPVIVEVEPLAETVIEPITDPNAEALQAQNEQLHQALQTMQEREAAYQEQINIANDALAEQAAANAAPAYEGEEEEMEEEEEFEEEEMEEDDDEEDDD